MDKSDFNSRAITLSEVTYRDLEFVRLNADGKDGIAASKLRALAASARENGQNQVLGVRLDSLANCTLADIYRGMPGLVSQKILAVRQLFPDWIEVHQPVAIDETALNERLALARETGFLLIGPDETIAALLGVESEVQDAPTARFAEAYQVSPEGHVRYVHGIYPTSIDLLLSPRSVQSLRINEAEDELATATAHSMVAAASEARFGPTLVARAAAAVEALKAQVLVAEPSLTESGAIIRRSFDGNGSASKFAARLAKVPGWRDFDTPEDAWYFGIWFNPVTLELATYTEGDIGVTTCSDKGQFMAELKRLACFYASRRRPAGYQYGREAETASFDCLTLQGQDRGKTLTLKSGNEPPVYERGVFCAPLMAVFSPSRDSIEAATSTGRPVELSSDELELDLYNPLAYASRRAYLTCDSQGQAQVEVIIGQVAYRAVCLLEHVHQEAA